MNNKNFIRTIEKNNEILIYNCINHNSIILNKKIYNMIKNFEDLEDFINLSKDYELDDRQFFVELGKKIKEQEIFSNSYKKELHRINYIITEFCNLQCSHCCRSAFYLNQPNNSNVIANIDIIKKIVDYNPKEITITGGEPLIVKNLDEIINYLKYNYKGKVILSTNAILINETNVKNLSDFFNGFDISIDGINQEKCDEIRGEGTFCKVIKNIELLKKYNAKGISLSIALDRRTRSDTEQFIEMCKGLGVTPLIRRMSSLGRASDNGFDCEENNYDYFDTLLHEICNCPAGLSEFSVDYKGNAYPCNNFTNEKYNMGNILHDDIIMYMEWSKENVWFKNFSQYVSITRDECKECEVNMFCWHCPMIIKNFMESNKIDSLNNICANKKQKIYEVLWDGK